MEVQTGGNLGLQSNVLHKVPPKIRVIHGLNEMEHTPFSGTRSEMSVNEVAAHEMTTDPSFTTDALTARDSSQTHPDPS